MKTIAFITRIHPKRPGMLKICVDSVKRQTDDDYIHILHRHDKTKNGYGKLQANQSFAKISLINARYVMVLDDDDMLIDSDFVRVFRKAINNSNPEIVFFKGRIAGSRIYPLPQTWGKPPILGAIASFCFAVRLDVWKTHIHKFGTQYSGGDFRFISGCYRNTTKHLWLDRIVAITQKKPGCGKGEDEYE